MAVRVCFNSTLVRFKVPHMTGLVQLQLCFNSTLVRFKVVEAVLADVGGPLVFQFHIGSIQRIQGRMNRRGMGMFQFHIGSIQRYLSGADAAPLWIVSIPHWFDSKLMPVVVFESIVRFQFHIGSIQRPRSSPRGPVNCSFNSTLVRFKGVMITMQHQTTEVSIPHWFDSKPICNLSSRSRLNVSIPHWFDSKEKLSNFIHYQLS